MKIQKYTNSKGKYLNKAFYKSINLNNRLILIRIIKYHIIRLLNIILLELINIILLELIKKIIFIKITKLQKFNYYDYMVIKNDVTNYSNSRRIIR